MKNSRSVHRIMAITEARLGYACKSENKIPGILISKLRMSNDSLTDYLIEDALPISCEKAPELLSTIVRIPRIRTTIDTWFGGLVGLMDHTCIMLCAVCPQRIFLVHVPPRRGAHWVAFFCLISNTRCRVVIY